MKREKLDQFSCLSWQTLQLTARERLLADLDASSGSSHLSVLQDELNQMIETSDSPAVVLNQLLELLSERVERLGDLTDRLSKLVDEQAACVDSGAVILSHSESSFVRRD